MAAPPPNQQKAIVTAAARRYGINPRILWGLYGTETNFGRNLGPSSAGAVGYFQFEPGTARSMGVNPYDFRSAAYGAARYLSQYKSRGTAGMLSAYNAGPGGGMQPGYVRQVLAHAGSYGAGAPPADGMFASGGSPGSPGRFGTKTSFSGGQVDWGKAGAAVMMAGADKPIDPSGKFHPSHLAEALAHAASSGKFTTPVVAHGTDFAFGGANATSGTLHASGLAGGFLPQGRHYTPGRKDQGRDGQTDPGGAIIAPGDGVVVSVGSDPNGFGPRYPIVRFTSGPYAGRTIYIGHTLSVLRPGAHFHAGQVLSHTGTHGIGNATVPGWFEIGYAPGGSPGHFGQSTPF